MKILIIGGTGLISTAIVNELLDRKEDITLYNRGVTPSRISGEIKHIYGNRWDYAIFEKEMQKHTFDAVIDMIAFDPENARSLLRAFSGRVKQIIVCSTVCVYGGPLSTLPATENEPHHPVTTYGKNKSAIESILLDRNGQAGLYTTVIRPSYTTGEGADYPGLLFDNSLPDRLKKGLPVIIMNPGNIPWAISHVSDVAKAFVNALHNPKTYGQAYHVTSNEHTTWNGIFTAMAQSVGGKFNPVPIPVDWLYLHAPRRSLGIKSIYQYPSIFDNSKAMQDLKFQTTISLVETFRRQFEWMNQFGKTKKSTEDPFEDIMIQAYQSQKKPPITPDMDFNPWGNLTTN